MKARIADEFAQDGLFVRQFTWLSYASKSWPAERDRLSCHRFVANAFALLLHAIAYRLMYESRATVARVSPEVEYVETDRVRLATAQFDTLRLRLLKVAAHITSSVRRILIRLPRAFPLAHVFFAVAGDLDVT